MQTSSPNLSFCYGFHFLWLQPKTEYNPGGHSRDRGRWRRASSSGRGHCPISACPGDLGFITTSPRSFSEKSRLSHLWKECCPNSIYSPSWFHESLIISKEILREFKEAQITLYYSGCKQETVCYTHIMVSEESLIKRDNLQRCKATRASLVAQLVKDLPAMQETRVQSLGWEDSPGEGNGNPLQYSCLENPMERGAWWVTVHGVAKSHTHTHTHTEETK